MIQIKKCAITLICILFFIPLSGDEKYPVDISFLIADLKYTTNHEVKICEIQHGSLSTFKGDRFSYGGTGTIAPRFYEVLSRFQKPIWINPFRIADQEIKNSIKNESFEFQQLSELPISSKHPLNPKNIEDYQGFIFSGLSTFPDLTTFRKQFPGFIVVDAATNSCWIDKYKMSLLFKNNPKLTHYKPRWNAYPPLYSKTLASTIIADLPGDRFVIKPRKEFGGKGVLIVDANDLDSALKNYLKKQQRDSFIVEEFVSSNPILVPHLNNQPYEPTIRVAFFLIYNQGTIQVEFCGAYYRLPSKSITEVGTLNEKYKDDTNVPFFEKIDPAIYEKVKEQLLIMLPLFYTDLLQL